MSAVKKDISEEDIVQKIQELDGKGAKIMSILQEREQKGIELGIQQGILKVVKNAISIGMETKDIMDITGLTEEKVEEIRKEMLN